MRNRMFIYIFMILMGDSLHIAFNIDWFRIGEFSITRIIGGVIMILGIVLLVDERIYENHKGQG